MTDLRKAAEQALEALEAAEESGNCRYGATKTLREALAQPEQEPVAWIDEFGNVFPLGAQRGPKHLNEPMKPLYTTPPQRTEQEPVAWVLPKMHPVMELRAQRGFRVR